MTQVFREDGTVVPVTRVQAGPCVVTQVKTAEKDGASAVQIGYGEQKLFRLNKARQGHLKNLAPMRFLRDFRVAEDHGLQRGDTFDVRVFASGDKVQVVGTSKGRGFQGVVKRHGFAGSPASHGHKDQLRMPGSIGATDPARVFKGTRMAGHMGDAQVTVKNLEVVDVKPEENELLIKGAVPGARGGLVLISSADGTIEIVAEEPKEEKKEKETAPAAEEKEEKKDEKVEEKTEKKEENSEAPKENKEQAERTGRDLSAQKEEPKKEDPSEEKTESASDESTADKKDQ